MKKLYCFICGKYRKPKNPKISNIFERHKFILLFVVSFRKEKREKAINYMLNGKATIVLLKVGLIRIT